MHWELELVLYVFLVIAALVSLYVKDLLTAVVSLSVFSYVLAMLFVSMGAIDVGFTEAVVGAGVTGVLFVVMIYKTSRRSND
ncbi:MAG: hydrogenase subunit MbhD domain-containing protein [Bacteroidota bacterium]